MTSLIVIQATMNSLFVIKASVTSLFFIQATMTSWIVILATMSIVILASYYLFDGLMVTVSLHVIICYKATCSWSLI